MGCNKIMSEDLRNGLCVVKFSNIDHSGQTVQVVIISAQIANELKTTAQWRLSY